VTTTNPSSKNKQKKGKKETENVEKKKITSKQGTG
jgi:hypothetical protein